ncbi:hypothetical protein EYF80_003180 [Liparis tanakae]|uniref:Uncharacterized protein n=1 Tax=Liparis tanakae TaxID=230148 RepID=A0A4Z2J8J6_9TELE|nr:hypothetical protein EYF80_003180 [Liparis tanakae]
MKMPSTRPKTTALTTLSSGTKTWLQLEQFCVPGGGVMLSSIGTIYSNAKQMLDQVLRCKDPDDSPEPRSDAVLIADSHAETVNAKDERNDNIWQR